MYFAFFFVSINIFPFQNILYLFLFSLKKIPISLADWELSGSTTNRCFFYAFPKLFYIKCVFFNVYIFWEFSLFGLMKQCCGFVSFRSGFGSGSKTKIHNATIFCFLNPFDEADPAKRNGSGSATLIKSRFLVFFFCSGASEQEASEPETAKKTKGKPRQGAISRPVSNLIIE